MPDAKLEDFLDHPVLAPLVAARLDAAYARGYRDGLQAATTTGRRGEAVRWLRATLADGPRDVATIKRGTGDAGISWRTVERASRELGVVKVPVGPRQPWVWRLPESANSATVRETGLET